MAQPQISVGRRKESVARVRLAPGTGNIVINGRTLDQYFGRETSKMILVEPLKLVDQIGKLDVFVNAEKVRFTGNKETDKLYFTHTMHPGGAKLTPPHKLRERHPDAIFLNAVRRMLPRNALGRDMMRKLKVYAGGDHPHVAQKPEPLKLPA